MAETHYLSDKVETAGDIGLGQVVTLELNGDFDSGQEIRCEKNRDHVTITSPGTLYHTSGQWATTKAWFLPNAFIPKYNIQTVTRIDPYGLEQVIIYQDGKLYIEHRNWSGNLYSHSAAQAFSITYSIQAP